MENLQRHLQLLDLGFVLDDSHPTAIYNHENGTWIAQYALDQYSNKEWDTFLNEFELYN